MNGRAFADAVVELIRHVKVTRAVLRHASRIPKPRRPARAIIRAGSARAGSRQPRTDTLDFTAPEPESGDMLLKVVSSLRRFALLSASLAGVVLAAELSAATDPTNRIAFPRQGRIVEQTLKRFGQIEQRWKSGESNLPLVSIEWFGMFDSVLESSVSPEGAIRNGSTTDWGRKGWGGREGLNGTNLDNLKPLIDMLPPSAPGLIPVARRILVDGTRSNSWYAFTYDCADVPFVLERICDLTSGRIDWVVPSTKLATNATVAGQGYIRELHAAAHAPVAAASFDLGEAEVWDLQKWQGTRIAPFQGWWKLVLQGQSGRLATNGFMSVWGSTAVSRDGRLLVVGAWDSVFALGIPLTMPLTPQWLRRKGGEHERETWCRQLAILEGGESLAVALTCGIKRWSLRSGEPLSVLTTNTVPLGDAVGYSMMASRDGKVLVAELGEGHLAVWRSPWTGEPQRLTEHPWTRLMEISPEGGYLALHASGRWGGRLVVLDLKSGTRQDMPFRGCINHEARWGAWSADGKFLAVAGYGQWPCVYDTVTWKPILL